MVDNLEIKFKELNINVEKEHDLAFIQDVLEEEANGLAIDEDVCGMMLDLCYTKARDLLMEANNFAHYSERDNIEVEDLDKCKDQRGEDLCDSATRIRRSRALVNRYPINLPKNDCGMILPPWRNCQIGVDARLKGAFVKPSKSKDNVTNETDTHDYGDDDLINMMDLEKELLNSSSTSTSTSTSTDSGDTTDDNNDRDSCTMPTAPKKRKLDEPSPPIPAARKLKKSSGFPESYKPLKSSRSPTTLSAATASALEFALMRKPPPPKMQKVSRSKPKKLKLDPQLIKGGSSAAGGGGGSSLKSKSKQIQNGKSKGLPKLNTDAEKPKQTNIKNDAKTKTVAKASKPMASTKKTTTTGPTTQNISSNDKKGNATTSNEKSLDNANPTIDNNNSVAVGFRLPKINIIQNFKRDPRGPRSRRKR